MPSVAHEDQLDKNSHVILPESIAEVVLEQLIRKLVIWLWLTLICGILERELDASSASCIARVLLSAEIQWAAKGIYTYVSRWMMHPLEEERRGVSSVSGFLQ